MKKITFYSRNVYGVPNMYVADAHQARQISKLTGRKTIFARDMEALEELGGFTFVEIIAPQS